jgi:hypothetical protein
MNCVADHKTDPSAFKKIIGSGKNDKGGNDVSGELRDMWIGRMKDRAVDLRAAARSWAGIADDTLKLEEINPFWSGIDPPSLVSLPHITAQALLAEVSLLF